MIVCVCKAVSDRQIRHAAKSGVTCVRDLAKNLGVGTCCGKCVPEARAMLRDSTTASLSTAAPLFAPA